MNRRRGRFALVGHPLLVGSLAIFVVTVGVYISYTATKGLPYVPKYRITVQVPDAVQLFKAADVTIAGNRVGSILSIKPGAAADGRPVADLHIAIDKKSSPLPADTTSLVRISGTLGSKYLQLTPGTSSRMVPESGTLPVSRSRPEVVEVDQLLSVFRRPVRDGVVGSLDGFGTGFAGRGEDLNRAIVEFGSLLGDLEPVMRALAGPARLGRFARSVERLGAELAPVADELASLFADLDTTFSALAGVAPDIQRTIAETPGTLDATTRSFGRTRPLLLAATGLLHDLRPGARVLPRAAPELADALTAGSRTLLRVPALSDHLVGSTDEVARFANEPDVLAGLGRIADTADSLKEPVDFLTPVQTRCNYAALSMRNLSSVFGEHISTGTTVRVSPVVIGVSRNNERGPSNQVFRGKAIKAVGPTHTNPYPNTRSPGQPKECEAGSEPYLTDQAVLGNVPGTQQATTEAAKLP